MVTIKDVLLCMLPLASLLCSTKRATGPADCPKQFVVQLALSLPGSVGAHANFILSLSLDTFFPPL